MNDPISAFQQEDGKWIAVVKDERGVERWRTWAHEHEAGARLTAYTYLSGTKLRAAGTRRGYGD